MGGVYESGEVEPVRGFRATAESFGVKKEKKRQTLYGSEAERPALVSQRP